jgi:hypothetical protein
VNREALFNRLTEIGLGGRTLHIIKNLYYNDRLMININGEDTRPFYLTNGLKQVRKIIIRVLNQI